MTRVFYQFPGKKVSPKSVVRLTLSRSSLAAPSSRAAQKRSFDTEDLAVRMNGVSHTASGGAV